MLQIKSEMLKTFIYGLIAIAALVSGFVIIKYLIPIEIIKVIVFGFAALGVIFILGTLFRCMIGDT